MTLDLRTAPATAVPASAPKAAYDLVDLKVRLHQKLLDAMNLAALDKLSRDRAEIEIGAATRDLLAREQLPLTTAEKQKLALEIVDEVLGLGPIEPLLKDDTVSDILVNTEQLVFVERFGRVEETPIRFRDSRHLLRIVNKIVARVGRRVDESHPMVDARLPDGSRVNAVIPPIAVDGPLLSIRKFARTPFSLDRLVQIGTLTKEVASVLEAIVR